MRRPSKAWILAVSALLLLACDEPETDPSALRTSTGEPLYADGVYAAAFSHTGASGWRPWAEVTVEAGLLTEVCLDAVNYAGVQLMEDERYLEGYRLSSGVQLRTVIRRYEERVEETQVAGFPVEPRAVEWAVAFDQLVRRTLSEASEGPEANEGSEVAIVEAWEPFLILGPADEHGWRPELMTIHNHERIVAAHYKETRPGGADGLLYKRDTERYTTLYEQVDGLSFADVAESIAELTVAAGAGWHSTDPYADAVTGATLSFSRAAALLNRTAAVRTAAALPRRLCD